MKTKRFLLLATVLAALNVFHSAKAQPFFLDCSCLSTQAVLITNACQAVVPDLCQFTNCWRSTVVPPVALSCSQSPPAGTPVGPGAYGISVTITDPLGTAQSCALLFQVKPPASGCNFMLNCASNKTVECGTVWSFDPPVWTNACIPPAGTPSNGVTLTIVSTVTNGTCPQVITRTWQAVDDCMNVAMCSQSVTVVDTTPPTLTCACITNSAVGPLILTVTACQSTIPDLCHPALTCAFDACGPPTCSQTPPAGTGVGPGVYPITVTVTDCAGNSASCTFNYTVISAANGPFGLICASNKTVECGSTWTFNPPTPTNNCCPVQGTTTGVTLVSVTTVTNGTCPMIITRTWTVMDGCNHTASCSQIVTVVDTTPPVLTCICITNSAAIPVILTVTACTSSIPDLCLPALTCASDNCGPLTCSQTPPAGTGVGPGVYPITVTVTDCASNSASCTFNYTVISAANGPFGLICASNKTVECGSTWTFNQPTPTNNCCPVQGTTTGVTLVSVTTVTNGTCPMIITRTWTVVDGCNHTASCSQIVTVVDTTAPVLDCNCLANPAANPLLPPLMVVACRTNIPDLCPAARFCATDNCGPLTCSQTPAAGTPVGPGNYSITVTITDCASNSASCSVHFVVVAPPGGCCVTPPGGMVAWWPLDELTGATLFADATGNGHTALVESGGPVGNPFSPTAVSGMVAGANYFYGLAPRGRALNAPLLNFGTGSFSADCWVNPVLTGMIHWHPIVDKLNQTGPTTGFGYTVGLLNQRVVLKVGDGTLYTYTSVGTVAYAAWNFVAVVVNRTANTVIFHVNGVTETPQVLAPAGNFNSTIDLLIGSTWNNNIALGELAVDELELFGLALGTNVVSDLWNANSSGKCKTNVCNVSIFCPNNIITNASCTQMCATVNYPAPLVANGVLTGCAPPPGTCFPIGTNTVTCAAVNPCGPTVTCSFAVIVRAATNCCTTTPVLALNSGVNSSGPLPGGSLDPQFLTGPPFFTTPNPYVPAPIHPLWLPNTAVSKWVSPFPGFQGGPTGNYFYTNRFFLCSTNQAALTGRWAGDDTGDIRLNGGPPGNFLPASFGFASWTPVSITSGFVPGWNTLVFRITNSVWGSVTGLRTEIRGIACCNPCVAITCPPNQTRTNCPPGGTVSYPAPTATSACGNVVSLACTPASGSFFPLGTNTVTCTAIDSAGNAATCNFTVTVRPLNAPVTIMCPPNQTIFTCGTNAVAYYKVKATGQAGLVVCTPPSGTTFPLGTNVVTCTATNICGQGVSCSFLVIVKKHPLGPPALTITAGNPDNFVLPVEPSPPSACMIAAFSGFPSWKDFDQVASDRIFGHRFTGLPNNIVKAELVVHMKPSSVDPGAANDGIFIGLPTCLFTSFRYSASIAALPPAGGNWNPGHLATTFTLDLGVLNPLILSDMNSQTWLDVVVHDDTTVDYMQLRLWLCPPPHHGIGVPYDLVAGATTALRPVPSGVGVPVGPGLPAICIFPNPNLPSGILMHPGAAKSITFTTVLDFEAAEGAGIDLVLPSDPRNPNGMPYLSFRSKGKKGYCVKTAKLYDDEPDISYRSIAIGTNGDLLPSITWDAANIGTNVLLYLNHLDGVTGVVMTVTLDLETREASLEFPDCIWTPDNARKGWDGCIYGNGTPSKGTNKTARLILTPTPPHTPLPPVVDLSLLATGLAEVLVEDPEIQTMGRKWGDGHVTLMKAYDDGETERLSFITVGEGGGVHTDLGNAAAFTIGFHHFENGDIPDEEQLFRLTGPIRGLTNRPTPPQIPLRLARGPNGVECTVDFSDLAAESIRVELWSNGVLAGFGTGPGAAILPESPLIIDRWPDRMGRPAINEAYLSLFAAEPFTVSGIMGDELRFIPGLPPGMEFPATFSHFECLASDGMDNLLYGLQRTVICPPTSLTIARTSDGILITWPDDGYRLQGAEGVTGPWFDLGTSSPVSLGISHPARYFKLICD